MRPAVVTQSTVGRSQVIPLDYIAVPFNVSVEALVTGVVNYSIQHTFDDIFDPNYNPATGNWWNNDNPALVNATTSQVGNYQFPIRACSLLYNSGSGSVQLKAIQGLDK